VRLGIGASRGRLVRQFLTESLLLAGLGGAAGLLVALVGIRAILAVVSSGQWPVVLDAAMNGRVLLFTALVSLMTGIGFGLVPAFRSTRVDVATSLKTVGPAIRRAGSPVGRTLLVGQVAVSVLVVVTAALLGRSLYNLRSLDTGFARDRVLLFDVETRDQGFTNERRASVYAGLLDHLRGAAGVTTAALADRSPIDSSTQVRRLEIPGAARQPDGASAVEVTPAYFQAFGIPLLWGRLFSDQDRRGGEAVALVNETLSREFGEASPIGRTILLGGRKDRLTIIGVVADVRHELLRGSAPATVYTPLAQPGESFDGRDEVPMKLTAIVRTSGDSSAIAAAAPSLLHEVDPDAVVAYVRTMEQQLDGALINERLLTRFSVAFGLLGLVLAVVGLYGVMAYRVARRRHEIAIRIALGASQGHVHRDVLIEVAVVTVAGIAIGLGASLVASRTIESFLFQLSPTDPVTLGAVSIVMIVTALVAGWLPGRRAATTDPALALRAE
jgi:predicted permease